MRLVVGRKAIAGGQAVGLALAPEDECALGAAQPRRRLHQRIEHGLQVEGRAADHLEHVGGGGLLLQRLPQLVEEAHVLDGDHRLGGEVLDQLDLLVGERADLLAVDNDGADQLSLFQHRHGEKTSCAGGFDEGDHAGITIDIGLLRGQVGNVEDRFGLGDAGEGDTRMIA
jgi:hypothetical protein